MLLLIFLTSSLIMVVPLDFSSVIADAALAMSPTPVWKNCDGKTSRLPEDHELEESVFQLQCGSIGTRKKITNLTTGVIESPGWPCSPHIINLHSRRTQCHLELDIRPYPAVEIYFKSFKLNEHTPNLCDKQYLEIIELETNHTVFLGCGVSLHRQTYTLRYGRFRFYYSQVANFPSTGFKMRFKALGCKQNIDSTSSSGKIPVYKPASNLRISICNKGSDALVTSTLLRRQPAVPLGYQTCIFSKGLYSWSGAFLNPSDCVSTGNSTKVISHMSLKVQSAECDDPYLTDNLLFTVHLGSPGNATYHPPHQSIKYSCNNSQLLLSPSASRKCLPSSSTAGANWAGDYQPACRENRCNMSIIGKVMDSYSHLQLGYETIATPGQQVLLLFYSRNTSRPISFSTNNIFSCSTGNEELSSLAHFISQFSYEVTAAPIMNHRRNIHPSNVSRSKEGGGRGGVAAAVTVGILLLIALFAALTFYLYRLRTKTSLINQPALAAFRQSGELLLTNAQPLDEHDPQLEEEVAFPAGPIPDEQLDTAAAEEGDEASAAVVVQTTDNPIYGGTTVPVVKSSRGSRKLSSPKKSSLPFRISFS